MVRKNLPGIDDEAIELIAEVNATQPMAGDGMMRPIEMDIEA